MRKMQRGTAIVEFALMIPFLLLLTVITTEFGRALYQYNSIVKTVRDAARYLSIQVPNTKVAEAKNLVVYGKTTPAAGDPPLARGLALANVTPDPTWQDEGSAPIIRTVRVTVSNYTFTTILPTVFGIDFGTYTFTPITATMRSHL
jgi:Flp pilus assembly protein TadG